MHVPSLRALVFVPVGLALLLAPIACAAEPGWLGASVAEVTEDLAVHLGAVFGPAAGNGVRVVDVEPGAPAAGILWPEDVIVLLERQPIWGVRQFQRLIRAAPVHTPAHLTVLRGTSQRTVVVQVGPMPPDLWAILASEPFGFLVREAAPREADPPSARAVLVAVVDADSPAARAGLQPTDRIVQLNGDPIHGYGDFAEAVSRSARALTLVVRRPGVQPAFTLLVDPLGVFPKRESRE